MRRAVLAAVAAATVIMASSASADTYCVPAVSASCAGFAKPTLADAITAANAASNADDIVLAAGHFAGGPSINYETHVRGARQDLTFIDGGSGGYGVYLGHAASSIRDLTIHEPSGGPSVGLYLRGAAQHVTVDLRDNPVDFSTAVSLHDDGSFVDGAALNTLATTGADNAISVSGSGNALVSGVQVQGRYGISTSGAGAKTIRFASVTGDIEGIKASADDTTVDDSVVTGARVVAYTGIGATTSILATVRHVTVVGSYLGVQAGHDGLTAHMVASNSAVVGGGPDPETPDVSVDAYGTATGVMDIDYSFFRAAHALTGSAGGTETLNNGAHNVDGLDAKLVNLGAGDLRPTAASPLTDAGDPVPGGGEPMADLAGEFRAVNGRTDIGAYEYGRHAPAVFADLDPKAAFVGDTVRFNAGTTDADPGESPGVTWSFDDGGTATGTIVTHVFTTPGTHVATATATDPAGLTATASVAVPISPVVLAAKAMAPSFAFRRLTARRGVVGVALRCPVLAADCAGRVELRLASTPKAKGTSGKVVVLGTARYAIAHGARKTIKVKLTRSARRRLARARHGLRVKVVAKPHGAASKSKAFVLRRR